MLLFLSPLFLWLTGISLSFFQPSFFLFPRPSRGLGETLEPRWAHSKTLRNANRECPVLTVGFFRPRGSSKLCPRLVDLPGRLLFSTWTHVPCKASNPRMCGAGSSVCKLHPFPPELLRAGLCLPHQRRPLLFSDPPSLCPSVFTVSLAFLRDPCAFHSISLGPGPADLCLLLTSAEQQGAAFPDSQEGIPAGQRASWEEVTLGEWCFFGFFESCENVALSEQVKKKNQRHLPQMILFLRPWSRSW